MIPKYRAWNKETKTMNGMAEIYRNRNQEIELRPRDGNIILMQSTGLVDKNGKKIFEGDILASETYPVNGAVEYRAKLGMWVNCLKEYSYYEYLGNVASNRKIIGNIYENPEFLEVE